MSVRDIPIATILVTNRSVIIIFLIFGNSQKLVQSDSETQNMTEVPTASVDHIFLFVNISYHLFILTLHPCYIHYIQSAF